MAPRSISSLRHSASIDRAVRVEDYLNDKFQTEDDLDNIESLLEDVKKQQTLLQDQLRDAHTALDAASKASKEHSSTLQQEIDCFKHQQTDIDRRIQIVTQSEVSDDAVKKFNSSMETLHRYDVAKGYIETLKVVDRLSAEARANFRSSPKAALKPYLTLQSLANFLKQAQPAAEFAAPHLIDHVETAAKRVWSQMRDSFASDFEETLREMQWPQKEAAFPPELEQQWSKGVESLLQLQEPELMARDESDETKKDELPPIVLLPLEVMVKPLELRFIYHFDGDRVTNRLDKPEFFLAHVISLLSTYNDFFAEHLQPILDQHFESLDIYLDSVYTDATFAFITALLLMLRRKICNTLPKVSSQPQLLSHMIHELMNFDVTLKDEWGYDGGYGVNGWKGLTWEVLVSQDWFGKWLKVEKDFALTRYQSIVDASESGEIDYDSVDPGATKPTKAAIRVNDLLETITDRYQPLTSFSQKLRFLIDIQITIFDKFHERLVSSLEAYMALTSSIARAMQGTSKEELEKLQGLGGLERLCRVNGSAEYLEKKMRDWSDDIFFLDLWDELQTRARKKQGQSSSIAGTMSVEDVAGRTSNVVGTDEDSGALFDETANAYRKLRIRSEGVIQTHLVSSLRDSLRPYSRINPWSSIGTEGVSLASLAITAELDNTVQQLSTYFAFLAKVFAQAPLRRIARHVAHSLQSFFWDSILMRYSFSTYGGAQLKRDVSALWEIMDRYLGNGYGGLSMRKLAEGMELLTMDLVYSDENGGDTEADDPSQQEQTREAVQDVEKRMFRDNESAREVLEELGMEVLNESEARNVLEKRIELGN
ncbi:RAD50-interacting protein 1 [Agyrium rufum]|nr:RAD50-interacting protein 1 [Agyrium rufum]